MHHGTSPRGDGGGPPPAATLWGMRVALASQSPRRRALLERAGVSIEARWSPDVDETWRDGEHPVAYARRVAHAKAREPRPPGTMVPTAPVLAADTTVWIRPDAPPLGKPADAGEARHMLALLRAARRHMVTTAYALVSADGRLTVLEHESAQIWITPPQGPRLDRYLSGTGWRDKAGAYGIQEDAGAWVHRIEGSYDAVVGLPVAQVLDVLRRLEEAP